MNVFNIYGNLLLPTQSHGNPPTHSQIWTIVSQFRAEAMGTVISKAKLRLQGGCEGGGGQQGGQTHGHVGIGEDLDENPGHSLPKGITSWDEKKVNMTQDVVLTCEHLMLVHYSKRD